MTRDELRAIALRAVTIPSLEAELAIDVLRDALLEEGLIRPYEKPKRYRNPAREERAICRYYRWATWEWAKAEWPTYDPIFDWWHLQKDALVFGVDRSEDPTRLAGQHFTPAAVYDQIRDLYAAQIITRSQARRMFEYTPPQPTLIESDSPIQVYTNPMVPRDQGYLVSPNTRWRVINLDTSEKESDER